MSQHSRVLRFYAWLFGAAGAAFVLAPGLVTDAVNLLAAPAGARPLPGAERTLWLGLAGAMMAMICLLASTLAGDRRQRAAWDALLLSKAASTGLFAAFACVERNALFLVGALVDGAIFLHLFVLRLSAGEPADPWLPQPAGYEVYFLKLNDPATRDALWLRYTRGPGPGGAGWWVHFDAARRRVRQGRWEAPAEAGPGELLRVGSARLRRDGARGEGAGARWELAWEDGGAPPFVFVPEFLYRLGLAPTAYAAPLPLGRFRGEFRHDDAALRFTDAPGSAGHLWGRRMGEGWRWAHAVFPAADGGPPTVLELLSARARLGPLRLPAVTIAHLWHGGRHYRTALGATAATAAGWSFSADFGELRAEGEFVPPPELTARLVYEDAGGGRLECANSKTAAARLILSRRDGRAAAELSVSDTAAVETVLPA